RYRALDGWYHSLLSSYIGLDSCHFRLGAFVRLPNGIKVRGCARTVGLGFCCQALLRRPTQDFDTQSALRKLIVRNAKHFQKLL
ncbi:hypothetical protein ABTO78_21330, partial [Acinetobacter baumannii]